MAGRGRVHWLQPLGTCRLIIFAASLVRDDIVFYLLFGSILYVKRCCKKEELLSTLTGFLHCIFLCEKGFLKCEPMLESVQDHEFITVMF